VKTAVAIIALIALVVAVGVGLRHATAGVPQTVSVHPTNFEVDKTDDQWRAELSSEEYAVLRAKGTERAFTGEYWDHHDHGTYVCAGCGQPLFSSEAKFESGTGWPSYWQPVAEGAVALDADRSLGIPRVEVLCGRCGGHLGHVFNDGPAPTGQRYCINSVSMDFEPTPAAAPAAAPSAK
jgi:peptide-methionine (R)-S-oxide reductase